eukprot:COSAG05_NODE_12236_length_476_cov_0.687003_2_plen_29_part_01
MACYVESYRDGSNVCSDVDSIALIYMYSS